MSLVNIDGLSAFADRQLRMLLYLYPRSAYSLSVTRNFQSFLNFLAPLIAALFFAVVPFRSLADTGTEHRWKQGDKVSASFLGSSYSYKPAQIVGEDKGRFRIHYEGYSESYDAWVPIEQIRPLVLVAPTAAAPKIVESTAVGGTLISIQGGASSAAAASCEIGTRLERAGINNRAAEITAVDREKGIYQVKYGNDDSPEWLPPRLFCCCRGQVPLRITEQYFFGTWALFVGAMVQHKEIGGEDYLLVSPGAKAPPLVINPGNNYIWTVDDKTTINGQWRTMSADEIRGGAQGPAILLMNGPQGGNWQVSSSRRAGAADNRDQISVDRIDLGSSYIGTLIRR